MNKKPIMPPAGEAILAGDLEKMRYLVEDGSLLFRKGKTVRLREDIPKMVGFDGRTICTDAFSFALAQNQTEIARLLIDCGLVGQRHRTSVFGVYLQTAQTELQKAVNGRKEVAEKDCGEIGLAEKSEPAEGKKVREYWIKLCMKE